MIVERNWGDGRVPSVVGTWRMDDFGPAYFAVLRTGQTVAIPDIRTDPRTWAPELVRAFEGIGTRAILNVPLIRDGRMAALLFVNHPEPRDWTEDEVTLVEDVAGRLSSSVERGRAETARDRASALAAAQNRVLGLAVGDASLGQTLEAIVTTVENLSNSGALTSILLLDEGGQRLRTGAAPSLPAAYSEAIDGLAIGPSEDRAAPPRFRDRPCSSPTSPPIRSGPITGSRPSNTGCRPAGRSRSGRRKAACSAPSRRITANGARRRAWTSRWSTSWCARPGFVIERSNIEAAMARSEARYRQIVEGTDGFAIVTFDVDGVVTGWNNGAASIVGHTAREAIGQRGDLFYSARDRAAGVSRRSSRVPGRTAGRSTSVGTSARMAAVSGVRA